MFHMSANGIKLYEKHGIIHPDRCEGSHYRIYGLNEMQALGCGIQYRRYGFTMQETGRLLSGADEQEQIAAMRRRSDELEREIDELIRIRKSLRLNTDRAERALALLDDCAIEEKPAMYFLGSQRDDQLISEKSDWLIGEWVDRYAPHLSAAVLLDGPYFTQTGYYEPPLAGVAVDADMVLERGFYPSEYSVYLPPRRCLVTAVRMDVMPPQNIEEISVRVKRYAKEKQVTLYAGGVMRLVQCMRRNGKMDIIALLWAPLMEDHERIGIMK